MPLANASDEAWSQCAVAEEFESMLAGMVSHPGEPRDHPYVTRLRRLLAHEGLRRGLGNRLDTAEALVGALSERRM